MASPDTEERLIVTVDGVEEAFRRLVPTWLSIHRVDGGFIWLVWGLN